MAMGFKRWICAYIVCVYTPQFGRKGVWVIECIYTNTGGTHIHIYLHTYQLSQSAENKQVELILK